MRNFSVCCLTKRSESVAAPLYTNLYLNSFPSIGGESIFERDVLIEAMKDRKTKVKESLIVKSFLIINGIEESLYQTNEEFMKVVNVLTNSQTSSMLQYSPDWPDSDSETMTLEDVEALFEEVIHPKKKNPWQNFLQM